MELFELILHPDMLVIPERNNYVNNCGSSSIEEDKSVSREKDKSDSIFKDSLTNLLKSR